MLVEKEALRQAKFQHCLRKMEAETLAQEEEEYQQVQGLTVFTLQMARLAVLNDIFSMM